MELQHFFFFFKKQTKKLDILPEDHHSKINISFLSLVENNRHASKQLTALLNKIRLWQDTSVSSYIYLQLTVAIYIRTNAIFPKAIDFYIKGLILGRNHSEE